MEKLPVTIYYSMYKFYNPGTILIIEGAVSIYRTYISCILDIRFKDFSYPLRLVKLDN